MTKLILPPGPFQLGGPNTPSDRGSPGLPIKSVPQEPPQVRACPSPGWGRALRPRSLGAADGPAPTPGPRDKSCPPPPAPRVGRDPGVTQRPALADTAEPLGVVLFALAGCGLRGGEAGLACSAQLGPRHADCEGTFSPIWQMGRLRPQGTGSCPRLTRGQVASSGTRPLLSARDSSQGQAEMEPQILQPGPLAPCCRASVSSSIT